MPGLLSPWSYLPGIVDGLRWSNKIGYEFFLAVAYSTIQKVFSQVKCKVANGREGKFAVDNLVVEFKG